VFDGNDKDPHGYAPVWDGSQWVSDFRQSKALPGRVNHKMKLHQVFFVCFMLIISPSLLPAQSNDSVSLEANARKFVQNFYDTYVPKARASSSSPAWKFVVDHMSASVDAGLLEALKSDMAAQAQSSGDDIAGLDFDPFLDTQDPAERYEVSSVGRKDAKYLAYVYCVTSGRRSEKPCVVPELVHDNGRWRFVNFDYPEGGDLRTVLEALKADREGHSN